MSSFSPRLSRDHPVSRGGAGKVLHTASFLYLRTMSIPIDDRNHHESDPNLVEDTLSKRVSPAYFPSESSPSTFETIRFLEGPSDIGSEQRILTTVEEEFTRAFKVFGELGPCVTFFGSARTKPDNPYYDMCRETAGLVAKEGFTIMTGGGPGDDTRFYVLYLYSKAFELYEMGYASALAWLLLVVVLLLTVLVMKTSSRFVHYEGLRQ